MEHKAADRDAAPSRPIAMVSLDGGGVRGLSSLLIMRALLVLVTEELARRNVVPHGHPTLNPQDVFDIAVGTSTGGLIVLMMVKLDMSIDECIQQYKVLSSEIFAKERPALVRLFGSDWSKFSGEGLRKAIEKLLASKGYPPDLKLRSAHSNSMQGTVLCHEKPNPHPIFFCTHECQGPYRQQMLDCDLELRQAARATSAAPSYFEPMIIRGRSFTDGGIGETNNPSWEGKLHYHKNHGLREEERLVMINIGTGTLPEEFYEAHDQGNLRPWWTRLVPNGLVNALGLVADLIHIATESERRAADLAVISDMLPDQFFFERFSADTGIHGIKLDNWRAATDKDGPSELELKTNIYLEKPEVRNRMVAAAEKLADVYVVRNSFTIASQEPVDAIRTVADTNVPSGGLQQDVTRVDLVSADGRLEDIARIDLSIELGLTPRSLSAISHGVGGQQGIRGRIELLSSTPVTGDRAPSLVSASDPTRSPDLSAPYLAEREVDVDTEEALQGQGEQFETNKVIPIRALRVVSPAPPTSSPTRKSRRSSTYPPRSPRVEDD
ncbi:hypothetical protein LTR10_017672 [Elasticomyces elasticus]|uniref:PNPLA domain-containing protein n=1 Tax=Exophiala sideris TaxID=1016849 RepID=A0ABR0JD99_9EURO|nr:hypothetical protein LTR10_017672 [Elasticomyces elasticus]KAK5031079.1 hypothetical protein LTS07_004814 [Exophiala sideris]KAK5038801.1 hypothetical protein LTR13_003832 [Exophiala sideris]KAK5060684.1 hypothetical protein LTR69_005283 [Exophiala sideris]KAK5183597.1 hypothetical protein LTR44_003879 [Eurotiomycetes sp. CCFEE 6388]